MHGQSLSFSPILAVLRPNPHPINPSRGKAKGARAGIPLTPDAS